MLTALILLAPAFAAPDCSADGVPRARVVLATSPWREGTIVAEACLVDAEHPGEGDWQRLVFLRNDGSRGWSRPLGSQDPRGEVWWTSVDIVPQDVDGDGREEVILHGALANCGEGGCVSGTALLYLWPGLSDGGPDCGRRGFEEGQRGRLLLWENARFDVPGWVGPSWVRTTVDRTTPGVLLVEESWTALPPSTHDQLIHEARIYAGASGVLPHCAGPGAPGF